MKSTDDYLSEVHDRIGEYGQIVQGVLPTADSPQSPPWAYTVGNAAVGLPELVMIGLPLEAIADILNTAGTRQRELLTHVTEHLDGMGVELPADFPSGFQAGHYLEGVVGVPLAVITADTRHPGFPLNIAHALYDDVRGLQLVWPDDKGRYPFQDGYGGGDARYVEAQPLLGAWPA